MTKQLRLFATCALMLSIISCKTPRTPVPLGEPQKEETQQPQPQPTLPQPQPAVQGITVRDVAWAGATYRVISVDTSKVELKILSHLTTGGDVHNFKTLQAKLARENKTLSFAMNAGMFHPNMEPVGLYVENGRVVKPINLSNGSGNFFSKPNGFFAIDRGTPFVATSEKWAGRATIATQSGPMLLIDGAIHPSFDKNSTSLNIRNGIGVTEGRYVHLAISLTTVRLYDFAEFYQKVIGCTDALYLDGHISQAFIPGISNPFPQREFGTFLYAE